MATLEARRFSISVGVFAAPLAPSTPAPAHGDPGEVASIFWLPRRSLFDRTTIVAEGPGGRFELPAVRHEGHVVWGFTLRVLDSVLGPVRS